MPNRGVPQNRRCPPDDDDLAGHGLAWPCRPRPRRSRRGRRRRAPRVTPRLCCSVGRRLDGVATRWLGGSPERGQARRRRRRRRDGLFLWVDGFLRSLVVVVVVVVDGEDEVALFVAAAFVCRVRGSSTATSSGDNARTRRGCFLCAAAGGLSDGVLAWRKKSLAEPVFSWEADALAWGKWGRWSPGKLLSFMLYLAYAGGFAYFVST